MAALTWRALGWCAAVPLFAWAWPLMMWSPWAEAEDVWRAVWQAAVGHGAGSAAGVLHLWLSGRRQG